MDRISIPKPTTHLGPAAMSRPTSSVTLSPIRTLLAVTVLLAVITGTPSPVSASTATADGNWLSLPFPPASARVQHSAIYDPVRNRMVVFGGSSGSTVKNDVWELSLGTPREWKQLKPTGTAPAARRGHVAIYDPVGDRMIVQGGMGLSSINDVWALSLSGAVPAWTQLAPTGTPPAARFGHSGVYDSARNRLVIHGGQSGIVFRNDVWALALGGSPAWTQVTPTGGPPALRSRHSAIYDTVRDRMVVFGGTDGIDSWNDTWSLAFAGTPAWSELLPTGTAPTPRFGQKAIYDAPRDRMVLHGGNDGGELPNGQVFTLGFASTAWATASPSGTGPGGLYDHGAIFDTAGDRMVFFAGSAELPTKTLACLSLAGGMSWVDLAPIGVPPFERLDHAAAYDPLRDRMIVFGGSAADALNDVWSLQMVGLVWTKLAPSGQLPAARSGHLMIHDPVRDRMIVFAGTDGDGDVLDDVWALNLAGPSWSHINPSGQDPPPRTWTAGVYDPVGDRIVLFGGYDGLAMGDVWQLTLAGTPAWSQVTPSGTPPAARWLHCAARIPATNEMFAIAGTDSTLYDDVWKLNLTGSPAWTKLIPGGPTPPGRLHAAAIYDPVRTRVVMYGGSDLSSPRSDTWALSVSGSPTWSQLAPTGFLPAARSGHSAIYDPVRDRVIVYGGFTTTHTDETLELAFGVPTSVPEETQAARAGIRLRAAYPNPFHAEATIAFELAHPAAGNLSVYDVHGRRIRELTQGILPAGVHRVRWDGRNEAGQSVASGSYFYRLEADGFRLTRKVILIR